MKRSNSITMIVKEIWQGTFSFCKPVNGRKAKMVRREDWGQHKNGTLFVFDNVAEDAPTAMRWTQDKQETCNWYKNLGQLTNTIQASSWESLRNYWRSIPMGLCSTTSTNAIWCKTSGPEQCAIGIFGYGSSHVETLLLWSGGLWSFTQETCPGIAAVKLLTQTHMTNQENTG